MKKLFFFLLALTLVACSSATSIPTATLILPTQIATETIVSTQVVEPTATPTSDAGDSTPTPGMVKEFQICGPKEYEKCVISKDDLLNGNYLRWLQTKMSKPFGAVSGTESAFDIYKDAYGNPDIIFTKKGYKGIRKDVTSAIVYVDYGNGKYPMIVRPLEVYNPKDPQNNAWVITVDSYYSDYGDGKYVELPNLKSLMAQNVSYWSGMKTVPIMMTPVVRLSGSVDPLVSGAFDKNSNMMQLFEAFANGQVDALSQPGVIVLTMDATGL